jgi:hypothetical protein
METRGRRPTWNDYKLFRKAVDTYFEDCAETDTFPDYAGMLLHLQITKQDAKTMVEEGAPNAEEFARIFNIAQMRRESWLARHMVTDNKKANGCMNALKQIENGGYVDKAAETGDKVIKVQVEGIGGGMAAFR